jgi:hypothetical protein
LAADSSGIYGLVPDYTDAGYGSLAVERVALDGGMPVVLGTGPLPRNGVTMVLTEDAIAWSTAKSGSSDNADILLSLPKAGGTPTLLASAQGSVTGIASDGSEVFWISDE